MTFKAAKQLHNGDEVVAKETGESIKVLSVKVESAGDGFPAYVLIAGLGQKSGYGHWQHTVVK